MPLLDHVGRQGDRPRPVHPSSTDDLFGFEMVDRRMLGRSNVEAAAMEVGGSIIFLLHEASFQARSPEEHGGVDHFCLTFTDPEFREILERIKAMGVKLEGGCGAPHRRHRTQRLAVHPRPGRQPDRGQDGTLEPGPYACRRSLPATVVRRSSRRSLSG